MKLYLLLIPLLAAMACAPSVSQGEYDGLSADFRQSQTEVSELKSQLNTAESKLTELEGQVEELTDLQTGLRERLAAAGQERAEPTATPCVGWLTKCTGRSARPWLWTINFCTSGDIQLGMPPLITMAPLFGTI